MVEVGLRAGWAPAGESGDHEICFGSGAQRLLGSSARVVWLHQAEG